MVHKHLSYANVVATLALILATSGVVYASSVPRNSVGARQLKDGAVTTEKLARGAVTAEKVRNKSLTLTDLGGNDFADFEETTTSKPLTLDPGECKGFQTGNFANSIVGDMVVGTLTDANGDAVLEGILTFIPSIVIKSDNGAVPKLLVCNAITGAGTVTIPTGSVFHWRLIDG